MDKNALAQWDTIKNFQKSQFDCKHTGKNEMRQFFMEKLDELAHLCGFRIRISSGYRDPSHPEEMKKGKSGAHSAGVAADLMVEGAQALVVLQYALKLGFVGYGLNQKGDHRSRYIHLDLAENQPTAPRPWVWTY